MKMDGRDSAEYQIWENRDIMVIRGFDFKSLKDMKNLKAKTLEKPRLSSYFCNERNRK